MGDNDRLLTFASDETIDLLARHRHWIAARTEPAVNYFEDNFISQPGRRGNGKDPVFAVAFWIRKPTCNIYFASYK